MACAAIEKTGSAGSVRWKGAYWAPKAGESLRATVPAWAMLYKMIELMQQCPIGFDEQLKDLTLHGQGNVIDLVGRKSCDVIEAKTDVGLEFHGESDYNNNHILPGRYTSLHGKTGKSTIQVGFKLLIHIEKKIHSCSRSSSCNTTVAK